MSKRHDVYEKMVYLLSCSVAGYEARCQEGLEERLSHMSDEEVYQLTHDEIEALISDEVWGGGK